MKNKISRAKEIYQEDGLLFLCKRALVYLSPIYYRVYYLYENTLDGTLRTECPENCSIKILYNLKQLDKLVAEGYKFNLELSPDIKEIQRHIRLGCITFCAFIDKKFAHITCIASNESSKLEIDHIPFKVDYESEACIGASRTNPEYRRRGIYTYVYSEVLQYLKERNISRARFTVERNITAANRVQSKLGSKVNRILVRVIFFRKWIVQLSFKKKEENQSGNYPSPPLPLP